MNVSRSVRTKCTSHWTAKDASLTLTHVKYKTSISLTAYGSNRNYACRRSCWA